MCPTRPDVSVVQNKNDSEGVLPIHEVTDLLEKSAYCQCLLSLSCVDLLFLIIILYIYI